MVDENNLAAAHEVGHQLIGKARGLAITGVSIRHGRELNPFASYDPTEPTPPDDQMAEILLAGWAGEAYILSHPRDCRTFDERLFQAKIREGRIGTGWPWGLFIGGGTDCGRIARLRGNRIRALFPKTVLTMIAKEIHARRDVFFEIVDRLVEHKRLSGEVVNALANGENWSNELREKNSSATYDHDLIYFFPKEQLSVEPGKPSSPEGS